MALTAARQDEPERVLSEHDFIVSKTDLKGRITYGNRMFIDYAGLSEGEFLGQNHNVIRHPDMPKAVFKLLWERLQSGQEVFAFVKNRCKNGAYYWVYANVTPSFDLHGQVIGYYSVRRKPHPQAVSKVAGLYRQMLHIEHHAGSVKDGMEQAMAWLNAQLQAQGTDYDTFVYSLQKG